MPFAAALFDLDGLLFDSEPLCLSERTRIATVIML
jgi:beta-phosphoglucomutase-like phosphatase (HAD superfamily)